MKKKFYILGFLILPFILVAAGRGIIEMNTVTPDSTTATEVLDVQSNRKGVWIKNMTGGTYEVHLATFAATLSSTNTVTFILNKKDTYGCEWHDEGDNCYTGSIYCLGSEDISTSSIRVIEKW